MKYTEELKKLVSNLFASTKDPEVVKQWALAENELNKIEESIAEREKREMDLIKDLKDAYIFNAKQSQDNAQSTLDQDIGGSKKFDSEAYINKWLEENKKDQAK